MLKKQHELFVSLLCLSDAAFIVFASLIAWLARKVIALPLAEGYRFWPESWETYFKEPLILFSVPITLYSLWFFGLYQPRRDRTLKAEYVQLVKASIVAIMALVVVLWAVSTGQMGGSGLGARGQPFFGMILDVERAHVLILAVVLPAALIVHRTIFRFSLRAIRLRGWNQRHVAIIGVGRVGRIACQTIQRNNWTGLNVTYFISHPATTRLTALHGTRALGGI